MDLIKAEVKRCMIILNKQASLSNRLAVPLRRIADKTKQVIQAGSRLDR